jgi:hypothetical protein
MPKKTTDPENNDSSGKLFDAFVPESLKKLVLVGASGLLLTEEALRRLLAELKLPKDITSIIIAQSNRSKNEIIRVLSDEVRNVISQLKLDQELKKLLTGLKVHLNMEIEFESKDPGDIALPDVRIKPKIKRKRKAPEPAADPAAEIDE